MTLRIRVKHLATAARINGFLFFLWLGPGAIISWELRNSVAWVNFMSWYAIIISSATMWWTARTKEIVVNETEGEI